MIKNHKKIRKKLRKIPDRGFRKIQRKFRKKSEKITDAEKHHSKAPLKLTQNSRRQLQTDSSRRRGAGGSTFRSRSKWGPEE